MTPAPPTAVPPTDRVVVALKRLAYWGAGFADPPTAMPRPSRRRAVRALAAFLVVGLVAHFGFALWLDYGPPRARDPEYGKRLTRLQERVAENPGKPLVVVFGSSRTAMGVRPGVLAADPHAPLLFNFALVGSGPVMELMAFRRAMADGVAPAAVLVEYWPAFLREDGSYNEEYRIDVNRLRPIDAAVVNEYFSPATREKYTRATWGQWISPWYQQRRSLMNQTLPAWLGNHQRVDGFYAQLDDWGWLPGHEAATPEGREAAQKAAKEYYEPLFKYYHIAPAADRALHELVGECRARNIPIALLYLPESAAFRAIMPPARQKIADDHLARIRGELNLPLIDARGWVSDDALPDGFHLMQYGAAEFTQKLGPAVTATFPELKRK
ncbi:hypothetical protein [Fimbriiglobus ruber]|uniref:Uncharacterized protein n=1 Tax=Fimbriiglobus ruber TaxID=1908690 RepID=A0A225DNT3_9BACT|nr:hypothetical protein [Fimbriiglobus ruber]OWK42971.1 hypothetical protein FRUB_02570 [Fimbriiglobus ruber]